MLPSFSLNFIPGFDGSWGVEAEALSPLDEAGSSLAWMETTGTSSAVISIFDVAFSPFLREM